MRSVCFLLLILSITGLSACKKDRSGSEPEKEKTHYDYTPHFVPPADGYLQVSVNSLVLNVGNTATITARLFDVSGSSVAAGSLIWQSSNEDIVEVASGTVSARAVGLAEITVTDGVHGILSINVNVMAESEKISKFPVSVQWSLPGDVLVMQPNASKDIGNYTVYDNTGNAVAKQITLLSPDIAKLTVSGTTVRSTSELGDYSVRVVIDKDTLADPLKVLVANTNDTSYSVGVVPGSLPFFYDNNVTATRPIMLKVNKYWFENGNLKQKIFVVSPEKISLSDDAVTVDGSGYLTSKRPTVKSYYSSEGVDARGWVQNATGLTIHYKNRKLWRGVRVAANITGSYGVTMANEDTYNFCFDQKGPKVVYTSGAPYSFTPVFTVMQVPIEATYRIIEDKKEVLLGTSNAIEGYYDPIAFRKHIRLQTSSGYLYELDAESSGETISGRQRTVFVMKKGAGDCTPVSSEKGTGSVNFLNSTYKGATVCGIKDQDEYLTVITDNPATFELRLWSTKSSFEGTTVFDENTYLEMEFLNGGDLYDTESGSITKKADGSYSITAMMVKWKGNGEHETTQHSLTATYTCK